MAISERIHFFRLITGVKQEVVGTAIDLQEGC